MKNKILKLDHVYTADSLEILPVLPENFCDAVITDPVWPGAKAKLPGSDRAAEIFETAAPFLARIAPRLIIHLGLDTDPRILSAIPSSMKFVQSCRLRWVPPKYKGPVLIDCDVAYVFGHKQLPADGTKVLGSVCHCISGKPVLTDNMTNHRNNRVHPTPRSLAHLLWLVKRFSRPGQLIFDPFCGSGTTLIAAKALGRHYIGIDIDSTFTDFALHQLARVPWGIGDNLELELSL